MPQSQPLGQPAAASATHPIDLVHLRSQTMGDAALERELLALFAAQAKAILADLGRAPAPPVPGRLDNAGLLHTLSGSARAVGAWDVAAGAERLERQERERSKDRDTGKQCGDAMASTTRGPPLDHDLAHLGRSVADACAMIAQRVAVPEA